MVVMTERPSWSDERLDDLSRRMDEGFRRNDLEHLEFRREMQAGFDSVNSRLDRLQQTMIVFCGTMMAALIAALVAALVALFAA